MAKTKTPTDAQISAVMSEMGRRGGKAAAGAGGKAALGRLTPEQRIERARKAGLASAAARRKK
jgi:hypothetical protein